MRRLPVEGAEVTIAYLGSNEPAVITAVDDDGRAVQVQTLAGDRVWLRLNATGWYVSADRSARLQWAAA